MPFHHDLNEALKSNNKMKTILKERFIPTLLNLEAFLLKNIDGGDTNNEKYNDIKELLQEVIGKSLDLEAQAKGTGNYINWIFEDYEKKSEDIPNPKHTRADLLDRHSSFWDKFRTHENAHQILEKSYYPNVNDGLQSNYRVLILLTEDYIGLNHHILKIEAFILSSFNYEKCGLDAYIRSRELVRETVSLNLEITTNATYTGRCLNGILKPNASLHTKQKRKSMKRKDIKEIYTEY